MPNTLYDRFSYQINDETFDVTALGHYSTTTKDAVKKFIASNRLPANIKIIYALLSEPNPLPPTRARWGCWNVTRAGLPKNQQDSGYLNAMFWTKGTRQSKQSLLKPAFYAFQSANNTDNLYVDMSFEKTCNSVFGTPNYSYAYEDNGKLFDKPEYFDYEDEG